MERTRIPSRLAAGAPKVARLLLALLVLCCALLPAGVTVKPVAARQEGGSQLLIKPKSGKPFFVIGANYEGPTDRAWLMWQDDKFDASLIEADFQKAHSLGINTLRIFVQTPLRDDINGGDFSKLDGVTALARKYHISLILTLTDWAEPDLSRAGALNKRIAAHLASEPSILAYDTKNEPQFTDIVGAIYPSTTLTVPLQSADLIASYGERINRADIRSYRQGEGRSVVPARMSDEQAYIFTNYYKLYKEFLDQSSAWVTSHDGTTTLDYMASADSANWQPFLAGLDATQLAWVNAQMDGVRTADPGRPITVGYSNILFAGLPSNKQLDFQSVHRFATHGTTGLNGTFRVLDGLERTFPGEPVLLEEFGYPGQIKAPGGGVIGYDPRTTANLETAVWSYLYSSGYAGGAKWMLNNYPEGYDPEQNSYGLFDDSGQPKLTALALRQVSSILTRTAPGDMSPTQPVGANAASYAYISRDALIAGGVTYTGTNVIYAARAPSQIVVASSGGSVTLFSTDVATTSLNLPGIFGVPTDELGRVTLAGQDPQGTPWTPSMPNLNGDWLQVNLLPLYNYRLTVVPRAVDPADAIADPDSVYFPQTGHNLSGDFLHYWKEHGGVSIFGYPLTEPLTENGYTVQYFERNRFELHSENQQPYNVLLGRLGADMVQSLSLPAVDPFQSTKDHVYFPETGHSLSFAFLGYWQRHGGLAQFGYPVSEEMREVSPTDGKEYTVQYFERARFEYHPENKGDAQVLLGLLGVSKMKSKGWLP